MSVEAIAVVLNHSKATGSDRSILIGIANHAGDGGSWPSMATLAKYGHVTKRNAQKAVERLVELGEIRVHYNAGGTHLTPTHERTNRYEIRVSCPADCDRTIQHSDRSESLPSEPTDPVSAATPPVGNDTGGPPVASDTPPVSAATPHPLSPATPEPSLELNTPQPPATRGACRRHPDTPGDNCRACGTTQRQVDAATRRAAAEAKRIADQAAAEEDRRQRDQAASGRDSPTRKAAVAAARNQVAASRAAS